jgi:hypothetical protein
MGRIFHEMADFVAVAKEKTMQPAERNPKNLL